MDCPTRWPASEFVPAVTTTGATSTTLIAAFTELRVAMAVLFYCAAGECYINYGAAASNINNVRHMRAGEYHMVDEIECPRRSTLTITFIRVGSANATLEAHAYGIRIDG